MSVQRSKPGTGRKVWIWVGGAARDYADGLVPDSDGVSIMTGGWGEDFADCMWPVVVKLHPFADNDPKKPMTYRECAKILRHIASSVEGHGEVNAKDDCTGYGAFYDKLEITDKFDELVQSGKAEYITTGEGKTAIRLDTGAIVQWIGGDLKKT